MMIDAFVESLLSGLDSLVEYLSQHVVTCLVPAFFIAGAIAAFIKKDAILEYLGPRAKKRVSYPLASVSGTSLAVCSCTILPIFAGLYKKGSGIGPATAFLCAGPAINMLAIAYTAQVLGYDLGLARAVPAVGSSIVVGLLMATIFTSHDRNGSENLSAKAAVLPDSRPDGRLKLKWALPALFVALIAILVVAASGLDILLRLALVVLLTAVVIALVLLYLHRDEMTDWGYETWDLTKKILPILMLGTFVIGVIAYFLPPETFRPYLGGNSLESVFLASVLGSVLYMPTLLEVPIIGTTFGYTSGVIGGGPALALLLSGPTVSLPSVAVLYRIVGARKTAAYVVIVLLISALSGFIYGNLTGGG